MIDERENVSDLEKPSQGTPRPSLVYRFVSYLIVFPIFKILYRGKTFGNKNVPIDGPIVVVANHGSHFDPPLLGHALGRPVAFMAKEELFRIPLISWVISACGAYPVRRGASDREAIRTATSRLNQGWAIGVFLDGTRQEDGRCNKPLAGASLLAARSGSYLLPVAIINSHRALGIRSIFPRLVPIHLRIGNPIPPPTSRKKFELENKTEQLKRSINSMLDQGINA